MDLLGVQAMASKAIKLIARQVSSAYLQYKDHPCIANQVALYSSLDRLVGNIEEYQDFPQPAITNKFNNSFQL